MEKVTLSSTAYLVDRDLSTLAFNRRVLALATQSSTPLLERLRYLCIVSSNLDEFFEVRIALHLRATQSGSPTGPFGLQTYKRISAVAHTLVDEQYDCYNSLLIPALAAQGIKILSHGERTEAQRKWIAGYFRREVQPLLLPLGLDPAHPVPQVANKSLNFIVDLAVNQPDDADPKIGILRVPRSLPRFIRLPRNIAGSATVVVSLSSVIRAHLSDLFGQQATTSFSQFRITRDSDLFVDEEDVQDLKVAVRGRLETRPYGQPVRLEVSSSCSDKLLDVLQSKFQLPQEAIYRLNGPVNLVRFNQVIDLVNDTALLFKPFVPSVSASTNRDLSIFDQLKEQDVLVHHPFESFDAVVDFLRAAVNDPQVVAIKQTIYRAGNVSVMMELLQKAVSRGIDVTVVLELKARFDEENNIRWAEQLESIGVQLVYGVVGLKTHAKLMLITRREGRHLVRYAHLGTGNYNPQTAKLYTDFGYFTADSQMTQDIEKLFVFLANPLSMPKLKSLVMAPTMLQKTMLAQIESVARAARQGKKARIIAKMNSFTDFVLAKAIVDAARAGAKIDLIVRGSCVLQAPPELKTHLTIRSIVGRFLEHSRVFYFAFDQTENVFLSSADWMDRNMTRRVEVAWQVTPAKLKRRVIVEALNYYLADTQNAWVLQPETQPETGYQPVSQLKTRKKPFSAQATLMAELGNGIH